MGQMATLVTSVGTRLTAYSGVSILVLGEVDVKMTYQQQEATLNSFGDRSRKWPEPVGQKLAQHNHAGLGIHQQCTAFS